MPEVITLDQARYSKVTFDNGTLVIEKRTGGSIRHKNVPQSVFNHFRTTGNSDFYYENHIKNIYPTF